MAYARYARKVDGTQTDILAGLRQAGIRCWVIAEPFDLLVNFSCPRHGGRCWDVLECKPLTGKKAPKARIRTDQTEQTELLALTRTAVVTSALEALLALSLRHGISSTFPARNLDGARIAVFARPAQPERGD